MALVVADRLAVARQHRFVGRAAELDLVRSMLAAAELPICVLHIHGPGGIGKTTLLAQIAALARQVAVPVCWLDGRHLDPTPAAFLAALRQALALPTDVSPLATLAAHPGRRLLLVDTYEALAPLDAWLREEVLPALPADTLLVLAGREAPTPAWQTDPGWQSLVRSLPLRNLSPDDSRAYLAQRAVPFDQHAAVLAFTHGHPLALALVSEVVAQQGDAFRPESTPAVVKLLLDRLVRAVPSPAQRAALEACALVRQTTEPLLAALLDQPDGGDLFAWLRGRSFIECGPRGLYPHDLAREALAADLRWRHPEGYAELHRRARAFYARQLQAADPVVQQAALLDLMYLHRHNPVLRPFLLPLQETWADRAQPIIGPATADDWPALRAMVVRHEGLAAAALADHWFTRQPAGVRVVRGPTGRPTGFLALVAVHQTTAADRALDPAVRAAWEFLERQAPLRPGERATLFRFWMDADAYQAVSVSQGLITVEATRHYLTTSGLAYTFLPCADPDFWALGCAYADLARLPAADFAVDGRRYGMYGHDWRVVPPAAWLGLLAERELAAAPLAIQPAATDEPVLVLSEAEFAAAVRTALRDLTRPDRLRDSPLLRSRLVVERAGAATDETARAATLRALVLEAAAVLRTMTREVKAYRALHHACLQPAPSHERAAELLGLPYNTFRRHLAAGIAAVTEQLWQWELQGPPTGAA